VQAVHAFLPLMGTIKRVFEAARIQKFGQSTITAFHVTTQTIEQPQCAA
jgi:hypothetical protein